MKKEEMITAKEARKTSAEIFEIMVENLFDDVNEEIKSAVDIGEFSVVARINSNLYNK